MLRTLLALLVLSAGALDAQKKAASPAPAAVQAQPVIQVQMPSSVKVEMPSKPHEFYFSDVLTPLLSGLISGAAVILGIFLTNRNNQKANEENRLHEESRWLRERHFEQRKDFLIEIVREVFNAHSAAVSLRSVSTRMRPAV
jgi:hypothetical protein